MKRAQRRKYHYFYKTTCIITNRYYYGMHSTDNLDDGYLGSGKRLWYSIKKHGKENHKLEILEFFETRELLKQKEIQIVNEDLLKDPMCMNLQPGGGGGFTKEQSKKGTITMLNKIWNDKNFIERRRKSFSNIMKKLHAEGKCKIPNWTGKKHKEETKRKIGEANSISQKGEKNSQYGTCWITNEIENKKIYRGDIIPEGWRLGRKMV
jgi:hypothetical protein